MCWVEFVQVVVGGFVQVQVYQQVWFVFSYLVYKCSGFFDLVVVMEVVVGVDGIWVLVLDVFVVLWIDVWCYDQVQLVQVMFGLLFQELQGVMYVVGFVVMYVVGDQCGWQCWVLVVVDYCEQWVMVWCIVQLVVLDYIEVIVQVFECGYYVIVVVVLVLLVGLLLCVFCVVLGLFGGVDWVELCNSYGVFQGLNGWMQLDILSFVVFVGIVIQVLFLFSWGYLVVKLMVFGFLFFDGECSVVGFGWIGVFLFVCLFQ